MLEANIETSILSHVTVAIRNPAEPERVWEGLFLVDTGVTDCLVPRQHLESIGLKPEGQRIYGLADGSEIRIDITVGRVEFMGEVVGATIVMGEESAEPLLGVTALESVGVEVDPLNQTLKRLPSIRLRGLGPNHSNANNLFVSITENAQMPRRKP